MVTWFGRVLSVALAHVMIVCASQTQKSMTRVRAYRVRCDRCEMLMINGVACHERGCPNLGARYDRKAKEWVKLGKCRECGQMLDADNDAHATNLCCDAMEER